MFERTFEVEMFKHDLCNRQRELKQPILFGWALMIQMLPNMNEYSPENYFWRLFGILVVFIWLQIDLLKISVKSLFLNHSAETFHLVFKLIDLNSIKRCYFLCFKKWIPWALLFCSVETILLCKEYMHLEWFETRWIQIKQQ